jgi:hypothetical protein
MKRCSSGYLPLVHPSIFLWIMVCTSYVTLFSAIGAEDKGKRNQAKTYTSNRRYDLPAP